MTDARLLELISNKSASGAFCIRQNGLLGSVQFAEPGQGEDYTVILHPFYVCDAVMLILRDSEYDESATFQFYGNCQIIQLVVTVHCCD